MNGTSTQFKVDVRADENPFCARVIIDGEWPGIPEDAAACLKAVCRNWPKAVKTKYLITCGGFIVYDWPPDVLDLITDDSDSLDDVYEELWDAAGYTVQRALKPSLLKSLQSRTGFLTLGIDSYLAPDSPNQDLHIELVAAIDVRTTDRFGFTGKTYPTPAQQSWLLPMPVGSHFDTRKLKDACILGCHDLNMFSHRSRALATRSGGTSRKSETLREFAKFTRDYKPKVVLHHPHSTDTEKIWNTAISGMRQDYPHICYFASAGRYYNHGEACRSPLDKVLAATKIGPTLDFIVRPISGSRRRKA